MINSELYNKIFAKKADPVLVYNIIRGISLNTAKKIKRYTKNKIVFLLRPILLFTFIIRIINRSFNVETRFKDILAIISYSLFPNIFALFSLFLVEIILFGGYLFSLNPAPVVIKPLLAYTLIAFESLVIFWCIFLLAFGFYTLTKLKLYSIVSSILFFFILILVLYFTSYNIL